MNKNILIGFLIVSVLISGCTAPKTETQPTTTAGNMATTTTIEQTQTAKYTTNAGNMAATTTIEQTQTTAKAFSIDIKSFAFNPDTITISKGSTVTWTQFDSAPHTIKSVSGDFINSPSLSKGQYYSKTFNEAGTFEYYCSIHPAMKGKVIVN